MKTYERRQEILSALREHQELKIGTLAELLGVSEGTIRNDLNYLSEVKQVKRTHGGATLINRHLITSPEFAARASANSSHKRLIARWAADMVKDGDAIFLDDSTTAFHMVSYLTHRRNLTVVTNGIETALAAAQNLDSTVVLVGGIVRTRTVSVAGQLSERSLEGLHIRTAFLSCSGVSRRSGFTDADMETAQLKSRVVSSAERTVALVESSKFGIVRFSSFAQLNQVVQILTDTQVDAKFIEDLRQETIVTVCGDKTISSYTPIDADTAHYKIGFAGLGEQRPFGVAVRQSLEVAARHVGDIDLVVTDNQYDSEIALEVADDLIAAGIDLAIEFHFDERMGALLVNKFSRYNIPVIAIDIPMLGATFFGVDNYRSGLDGGVALGKWIQQHWDGEIDYLLLLERHASGPVPATRNLSQIEGLQSVIGAIPPQRRISLIDEDGLPGSIQEQVTNVLASLPDDARLAVISFNDASVEGVIDAARVTGRERTLACVSQGAGTRMIRDELRKRGSVIVGAVLFPPAHYGAGLIELSRSILRGQPIPPAVYIQHILVDATNIDQVHPEP
ncbi:MAG: substrate-binding domain-containing protein [Anaerolineae bacterium]|nr:substrate-binding domain-containing protein [Anaerolineae bacterium]